MFAAVVPPPHYAQRVSSDDPDEVTSWSANRDGDHSRVVNGSGPYGFKVAVLDGERASLAWARTALGNSIRGRFARPCVHIPIDAAQQYAFGRQRIRVPAGELAFIATDTETSRHSAAASIFAIEFDSTVLAAELRGRNPGTSLALPLFPRALNPSAPVRRTLLDAIAGLIQAFDPAATSIQRTHSEDRVVAALVDALTLPSSASRVRRLAIQRVADLEGWIDAHLGEAITMGRLCEAAQVSQRSLQLAFQDRRGMSPMRFVCERRLAAANFRIAKAHVGDNVTAIATSLGFTHLGRFAKSYREAFGESPSRTMLRSRVTDARDEFAQSTRESG